VTRSGARAASGTAELPFDRWKWRETTEKLPKSIEIDFGNSPLLSKSLPNFGRGFRYRPVPLRNPTENFHYRHPLKSGLPNLK
jgi:hypothetical protein